MAYKQSGFPIHKNGVQPKSDSPVKAMSESGKAVGKGVITGAAKGAAMASFIPVIGTAVGAGIGGIIGGVTANKKFKEGKATIQSTNEAQAAIEAEQVRQQQIVKNQEAFQTQQESIAATTMDVSGRAKGPTNTDGTVNEQSVNTLEKLYTPVDTPLAKKSKIKKTLSPIIGNAPIKQTESKTKEFQKFNSIAMGGIGNEEKAGMLSNPLSEYPLEMTTSPINQFSYGDRIPLREVWKEKEIERKREESRKVIKKPDLEITPHTASSTYVEKVIRPKTIKI
jgi:hypothetical protein